MAHLCDTLCWRMCVAFRAWLTIDFVFMYLMKKDKKMKKLDGQMDMSITYSTYETCPESGWYVCKHHTYYEDVWLEKGESFPKCSKVNCGRTEWYRLSK